MSGETSTEFQWMDDEIQLLLEAIQNLKVEEDYKGLNWEGKRSNYDRLRELITENYPKDGDPEKYPNYDIIEAVIIKERVPAKLKKTRTQIKTQKSCGLWQEKCWWQNCFYFLYCLLKYLGK